MGVVDGLSKIRMLAIEAASVVGGSISSGHLILTKHDGSTIDAGNVVGPAASISAGAPVSPIGGQMFFDSANFTGLTDLLESSNPGTSTANWTAYGYGYDTACTFSLAGGGVTLTGGGAGSHFAGINVGGLSAGESYFAQLTIQVPTGSPDVRFTVGYRTSGHLLKIKDQDVTLALAFTADGTAAPFGVEFSGFGPVVVKSMKLWVLNQRGYPTYIWDAVTSTWIETVHMAQKGDIYSRVNTFGDQQIAGIKQFTGTLAVGPLAWPALIAGSNVEQNHLPNAQVSSDNSSGGFAGAVIRGKTAAAAVTRTVGLIFKHSDESSIAESNKGWFLGSWSPGANSANRAFLLKNGGTGLNSIYVDSNNDAVTLVGDLTTNKVAKADQLKVTRMLDISGTNLNDLVVGGFYNGNSMTNAPDASWYYVEVLMHSNFSGATPTYMVQRATHLAAGVPIVYQRTMTGAGVWNSWYRVDAWSILYPEAWVAPTFTNSWVNYGSGFQTAGYRRIGDVVYLRGLVKLGTLGTSMFTLPVGYRPTGNILLAALVNVKATFNTGAASTGTAHTHPIVASEIAGRIDINTSGTVSPTTTGGNGWISLDGLSFSVS